jgi:hypothetical protein
MDSKRCSSPILWLFIFWALATSLNITKAVHIDDTAYLEIAKQILKDPFHPLSGMINWRDTLEPIHKTNQPALLFYLYALIIRLFGDAEIVLHGFFSLFTLANVLLFFGLARKICSNHALSLTALYSLSPAFLPSQNLMTDIPMMAFWLAFFWLLMANRPHYLLSSLAAGAACLIKYASLVLLPLLLLYCLLRRKARKAWVLAVPIIFLASWSLFNYLDYGGIHILSRPTPEWDGVRFFIGPVAWLIGLGGVATFSIPFIGYFIREGRFLLLQCLAFFFLALAVGLVFLDESGVQTILRALFFANGIFLTASIIQLALKDGCLRKALGQDEKAQIELMLLAWFLASSAFFVLFAPFMAVRHFLTVIPPALLLLGCKVLPSLNRKWLEACLISTVLLGFLVGISDWTYAHLYRIQAREIKSRLDPTPGTTVWFTGHLGWQWYATKAGMKPYDARLTRLKEGDLLVEPLLISKQTIAPEHLKLLEKKEEITIEPTLFNVFRIVTIEPRGGYYNFSGLSLPWTLSLSPLEKFTIYRVRGPISSQKVSEVAKMGKRH